MSWNERQRRMLAAMGVRLWSPAASGAPTVAAAVVAETATEVAAAERAVDAPAPATQEPRPAPTPAPAALSGAPAVRPPVSTPARAAPAAAAAPFEASTDLVLAERAAAIATLAWGPLQDAVAACTACGLCESRRQTVFGVGHARADWMIVGEAPGEQEDLQGEPFVGPAGQLLDQMLRAVGQSRRAESGEGREDDQAGDPARRVFIANTLKCRPPRNRNPEPGEMARCEPFLQRQVALVQPKLILLMGRFAVKQLLKSDEAIGKLRGRVHRYEGIPVVVTYHPAYLLRNMPDKAKAWEDLCLAKATVDAAAGL
jgi:uracil-DNA glycosylase